MTRRVAALLLALFAAVFSATPGLRAAVTTPEPTPLTQAPSSDASVQLPGLVPAMGAVNKPSDDTKDGGNEGVVNKLFGPGPLMEGHRNLEHGDCLKCHDAGKGVPDQKCVTCHVDIQKSVRERLTFHGLTKQPCIGCHNDHKGRAYNSTVVDQNTFRHVLTGFTLHGAHAKLACAKCHTEKRANKPIRQDQIRYFGKTETCVGCHKKDDVHHFSGKWAAKDCNACHSDATWKGAKFDHKRDTGYTLVGDHAKITCAACHTPKGKPVKYEFPELKREACLTCHVDFHKDKFDAPFRGGGCDKCHSQNSWKLPHFDHQLTGFSLKGKHAQVNCIGCHKQASPQTPLKDFHFAGLSQDCSSCHKDYHGFHGEKSPKMGPLNQCKSCHNEQGWHAGLAFNHSTQTNFPIDGKHIGVKCFACHLPTAGGKRGPPFAPREYDFPGLAQKTCELCHKSPHETTPNSLFRTAKCSECHSTDGWKVFKKGLGGFNHNTSTKFPLTGDHVRVSCDGCHLKNGKQVYKFAGEEKQFCETCHKTPHKDQFEPKLVEASCASCHDTVKFRNLKFNHNEARFKLGGAHAKLANDCVQCHKPTDKTLPVRPPRAANKYVFEHPQTGFCSDCHKNPHTQQFDPEFRSDNCLSCHNDRKWTDLSQFDHEKTRFKLTGAHAKLKSDCVKCHVKTNQTLPTTPPKAAGKFLFGKAETGFCEACHKTVHKGQFQEKFLAKPCRECHSNTVWDKRLPFDHNTTDFRLTGGHQKVKDKCVDCHKPTDKTLPTNPPKPADQFVFANAKDGYCQDCHTNEHKGQFHANFANAPCFGCHTVKDFAKDNKFDHTRSRYELKGKHLKVKCDDCHTPLDAKYKAPPHHHKGQFVFNDLLTKDCALCHKDPHNGRFGKQCSQCHNEEGWDQTASFHKDFVLTGVHYLLECAECHVDNRMLSGTGNDCKTCHAKDDVHMGSQPDCAQCHSQQFWSVTRFQHSLTLFPLRGAHRLLDCSSCHAQGVYEGKDSQCVSCHLIDAINVTNPSHKSPAYQVCDQCHSQFSFRGATKG